MELSVIIVSYNTKELLRNTIQSVIDTTKNIEYEIIVADNLSSDGSPAMVRDEFKDVKLIETGGNLGFSKANNMAIKQAKGKYILLLNSDTVVKDNALSGCLDFIKKDDKIGALGLKVILPSGQLDHACKRGFPTPSASLYYMLKLDKLFPNNKKFGQYKASYLDQDTAGEVDAIMGAFMLIPKKVIDEVGMLDEDFFMYGEDLDWCYRIKQAGYKIVYYPKEHIIHYKGSSSKKEKTKTIYEFHRAMILFYNKHYKKQYSIFTTCLVYIGITLKMILEYILNLLKVKK